MLNCAIDHRIPYMYFSDKASMHTKIETNRLALPVFLFYLSRPSRNIYIYDAMVTFLRFESVSVSILTLITAKEVSNINFSTTLRFYKM